MVLLGIILIVLVLGALLLPWPGRPLRHRVLSKNDLPRFIDQLIAQGVDGGLMFATPGKADAGRVAQVMKRQVDDEVWLELPVPYAPWTAGFMSGMVASLEEQGFSVMTRQESRGDVEGFAVVTLPADGVRVAPALATVLEAMTDEPWPVTIWYEGHTAF